MNNYHTQGSGNNGNPPGQRREGHVQSPNTFNGTGALPAINAGRSYPGSFDFEAMLLSLRERFALDRQLASQQESKRCGICYLYFAAEELYYREEEGFYVCAGCQRSLGTQKLLMLRRQQK